MELPKEVKAECFKRHTHGELVLDDEIVYKEADLLAILERFLLSECPCCGLTLDNSTNYYD